MKLFQKLIYIFTLFIVFSCQEEIEEEFSTNNETSPSVVLKEESADNLKRIILDTDSPARAQCH